MQEERRPLYVTQKELDLIARTPIFDFLPSWESLSSKIDWGLGIPECHDDNVLYECEGMSSRFGGPEESMNSFCVKCRYFIDFEG